jgi:hypothetical protein
MFNWAWVLQAAGAVVLLAGALAVIVKGVRWVAGLFKKINEFLEDWRGEPGRPGYAKRPGVMERLVALEQGQAETREALEEVRHEVKPNSGSSLKDQVTSIQAAVVGAGDLAG